MTDGAMRRAIRRVSRGLARRVGPLLAGENPYRALTNWDYQRLHVEPELRESDVVLDVGSGHAPCPRAQVLADGFPDELAHRAAALVEDRPLVVCSVERLPFKPHAFEFVLCSHVLEHVESPARAAAGLARIARAGYVETPAYGKDILVGTGDQHRWQVVEFEGELVFFEYSARQHEAHTTSPAQEIWCARAHHPWQDFFWARQDLFNAWLLWRGALRVTERRRGGALARPLPPWQPVARGRLPDAAPSLDAREIELLEARLATPDGARAMRYSPERRAFVSEDAAVEYPVRGRRIYCELATVCSGGPVV